jgi:RES domain-containing protein
MATVYSALDIRTATEESLAHHRYFGFPLETALPRVMISIRVSLQRVFDLTEQRPRRTLGVNRGQLLGEDWRARNANGEEALTQAIGRLAWENQWEAMLVPSAAEPKGVNLIIFPGNLLPPESYLLIINRDQLPPKAMPIH